jgi:hypothetical protein
VRPRPCVPARSRLRSCATASVCPCSLTLEELCDHVRVSLPGHAAPRAVELVSEIPLLALGKPGRVRLRGRRSGDRAPVHLAESGRGTPSYGRGDQAGERSSGRDGRLHRRAALAHPHRRRESRSALAAQAAPRGLVKALRGPDRQPFDVNDHRRQALRSGHGRAKPVRVPLRRRPSSPSPSPSPSSAPSRSRLRAAAAGARVAAGVHAHRFAR